MTPALAIRSARNACSKYSMPCTPRSPASSTGARRRRKFGELTRVHDSALLDFVLQPQSAPLRQLDMDTWTSPGSASAAVHAAGAGWPRSMQ